ncbi:hypothetical protein VTN31DRAFT_2286 [Thermomyces dupontii]|uniref:uncharacterized protein n=1 Tax=Talaromyces thermophilus TaxID=28565 RepID=UPI00374299DA
MKLVVRWLMPTPHGDTTPGVKMPIINSSDDPIDDNDDDVTTVETAAQSVSSGCLFTNERPLPSIIGLSLAKYDDAGGSENIDA